MVACSRIFLLFLDFTSDQTRRRIGYSTFMIDYSNPDEPVQSIISLLFVSLSSERCRFTSITTLPFSRSIDKFRTPPSSDLRACLFAELVILNEHKNWFFFQKLAICVFSVIDAPTPFFIFSTTDLLAVGQRQVGRIRQHDPRVQRVFLKRDF